MWKLLWKVRLIGLNKGLTSQDVPYENLRSGRDLGTFIFDVPSLHLTVTVDHLLNLFTYQKLTIFSSGVFVISN